MANELFVELTEEEQLQIWGGISPVDRPNFIPLAPPTTDPNQLPGLEKFIKSWETCNVDGVAIAIAEPYVPETDLNTP